MSPKQLQETPEEDSCCGNLVGKYKPKLDESARKAEEANRSSAADTTDSGAVSKLLERVSSIIPESGKKMLNITDDLAAHPPPSSEPPSSSDQSIKDRHVEEFVRDQHRSKPVGAMDE